MACSSSAPRSSSKSLSRPPTSAKISAPPASGALPAASAFTLIFKSSFAAEVSLRRNCCKDSAAAERFSWPFSIKFWVIGDDLRTRYPTLVPHRRERNRHELHHHLLLWIGGRHRRHFCRQIHRTRHHHRQNIIRIL